MIKFFITIIIALSIFSCKRMEKNVVPVEKQYFGLKPPGLTPEVFASGIVSNMPGQNIARLPFLQRKTKYSGQPEELMAIFAAKGLVSWIKEKKNRCVEPPF